MKIIVSNNSDDSYTFGLLTIQPQSRAEIADSEWFNLFKNTDFVTQIKNFNLIICDGFTEFRGDEALAMLERASATRNKDEFGSQVVTTQFEKRDKTLKLISGKAEVDAETGIAVILIKVPGELNPTANPELDGRWVSGGIAFFDEAHPGDKILSVHFTDEDNITGLGAGTIVGSYTDNDADEESQGWYIPPIQGIMRAESVGGYGFAPGGYYMKITGRKADAHKSGSFYCNIEWAKKDLV